MWNRLNGAMALPIAQGVIALGAIGMAGYLVVTGQDVPEWVVGVISTVVGFYFGQQSERTATRARGK